MRGSRGHTQAKTQETDVDLIQQVNDIEAKLFQLRTGSGSRIEGARQEGGAGAGAGGGAGAGSELDSVISSSTGGGGEVVGGSGSGRVTGSAASMSMSGTTTPFTGSEAGGEDCAETHRPTFSEIRQRRASTAFTSNLRGGFDWTSPTKGVHGDKNRRGSTLQDIKKGFKKQALSYAQVNIYIPFIIPRVKLTNALPVATKPNTQQTFLAPPPPRCTRKSSARSVQSVAGADLNSHRLAARRQPSSAVHKRPL